MVENHSNLNNNNMKICIALNPPKKRERSRRFLHMKDGTETAMNTVHKCGDSGKNKE